MSPDDPRHGQERGYFAHAVDGEAACEDCLRAHRAAAKRRALAFWRGQPSLIDATGTRRRIQALNAIGWPNHTIAKAGGWTGHSTIRNMLGAEHVRRANAEKIAEIYERLCMSIGPSAVARRRAAAAGWAPPLAWENIDDPDECPRVHMLPAPRAARAKSKPKRRPKPPCGTERGYQWHRNQARTGRSDAWPLPDDDPCGCRAAHLAHFHARKQEREVA